MKLYGSTCCRLLLKQTLSSTQRRFNSFQYCTNLVKKRDYQNYLALLLLPFEIRMMGVVVSAFNIELAQIQEQTSELLMARGRLEFWRKSLDDTFKGHPPAHPVTISLALCLEKVMVSKQWFDRLISIRTQYLNDLPFMTLHDAEEYGDYAVSSIFYILLEYLQCENGAAEHAASHLGKACSLVTLIRSVPHFIQQKKVFLPTELCFHHSVSHEDIIRNRNKDGVHEVIYDTASQAFIHLEHMLKILPDVPPNCKQIYLPSVICEIFLEHLRQIDFDVYNSKFNQKQWMLPFKLLMATVKK